VIRFEVAFKMRILKLNGCEAREFNGTSTLDEATKGVVSTLGLLK
jgi:hypothetical protein